MKLGHRQFFITVFSLALLACFGACSKSAQLQECSSDPTADNYTDNCVIDPSPSPTPDDPWYTPTPTPTPDPTVDCSNLAATLAKISPLSDTFVGDDVVFEVTVLNCPSYRIERLDGAAPASFTQQKVWFKKKYSYPDASMIEGIRVIGLQADGSDSKVVTAQADPFEVKIDPANDPSLQLSCTVTPNPSSVNIPVNYWGMPTVPFPTITFSITCNRPAQVVLAKNLSSDAYVVLTGLPTLPSTSLSVQVSLGYLGQNFVGFKIVDQQYSTNITQITSEVDLNAQYPTN